MSETKKKAKAKKPLTSVDILRILIGCHCEYEIDDAYFYYHEDNGLWLIYDCQEDQTGVLVDDGGHDTIEKAYRRALKLGLCITT